MAARRHESAYRYHCRASECDDIPIEYEYHVEPSPQSMVELHNILNMYGKAGWSISAVIGAIIVFSRPVRHDRHKESGGKPSR